MQWQAVTNTPRSFVSAPGLQHARDDRCDRELLHDLASRRWDSMFTAGLVRAIESGDQFTSELNAAELAVALRRFRLDRGSYPDELSALVPDYLASVPIDPFTGRPPVYTRKGAGFELHAERPKNRTPRPPELDWVVTK
jgi:hypothetical protein